MTVNINNGTQLYSAGLRQHVFAANGLLDGQYLSHEHGMSCLQMSAFMLQSLLQQTYIAGSLQTECGHDKLDDKVHYCTSEQIAIEAVQETPMAWDEIACIFEPSISLHHRLNQIPKQACKENQSPKADGGAQAYRPSQNIPEAHSCDDTAYEPADSTLHCFLGADPGQLGSAKGSATEVGTGVGCNHARH